MVKQSKFKNIVGQFIGWLILTALTLGLVSLIVRFVRYIW